MGTHGSSHGDLRAATRADALLERMRRYALEHLRDPGLGPDQIARAHFVSTRYVHKLFAAAGCGVAAWVREQRLERAWAELRRSSETSVASVAARWGYRDPASFSRAFRQTYGCSPRELRRGPDADPVRIDGARIHDGLRLRAGLAEARPRCRTSRAR